MKILFYCNKNFNYNKQVPNFFLKSNEGVISNSWTIGNIDCYLYEQKNKSFQDRNQCRDNSYICHPIEKKPLNRYGFFLVSSDDSIYWNDEDKEVLNLISIVVLKILNDVDDELKSKLNLYNFSKKK